MIGSMTNMNFRQKKQKTCCHRQTSSEPDTSDFEDDVEILFGNTDKKMIKKKINHFFNYFHT